MKRHSILLIDDQEVILSAVSGDLRDKGYRVTTAPNTEDGIRQLKLKPHDLIITDPFKDKADEGIGLLKQIKDIQPGARVVILTGYGSRKATLEAFEAGVHEFILKPYNRAELSDIIDRCLNEQAVHETFSTTPVVPPPINSANLSRREQEVVSWTCKGLSDLEISKKMDISLHTVKTHRKRIYKKLGIHNRAQLILTFKR